MTCPVCGADNRAGAKFCNECGTPLAAESARADAPEEPAADTVVRVDAPPPPVPAFAALPPRDPSELPPTHPEWRMSSAGPLPDPPKRRLWLWIVGALISCLVLFLLMNVLLAGIAQNAATP